MQHQPLLRNFCFIAQKIFSPFYKISSDLFIYIYLHFCYNFQRTKKRSKGNIHSLKST